MSEEQEKQYNAGFEAAKMRQKFDDTRDMFWIRGFVACGLMVGWRKKEQANGS